MPGAETEIPGVRQEEMPPRRQSYSALRRNPRALWLLAGLSLLVAAAVFGTWRYYAARESTDDAQIDGHIHAISAKVGGTVLRVHVLNDQHVRAGDVLVEIDPREYQVALERAQADWAEAKAAGEASQTEIPIMAEMTASRLSDARAQVEDAGASRSAAQQEAAAAQARLRAAQATAREASANSEKAALDLQRMRQLLADGVASPQQHDAAAAAAEASRAALDAATATVGSAEFGVSAAQSHVAQEEAKLAQAEAAVQSARTAPQQVAVTRARAASAAARLQQAQADLHQAQLNLAYAVVKAPVSGVVSKKTVEAGQMAPPGQPLLALVPLDDIWVTANFKETQLRNMRPGQKATISVDAYGGRQYDGHVDSIAAATGARFSLLPPENASGNYVKVVQRIPVKILLEKGQDRDHVLRPGMSVVPTVFIR